MRKEYVVKFRCANCKNTICDIENVNNVAFRQVETPKKCPWGYEPNFRCTGTFSLGFKEY